MTLNSAGSYKSTRDDLMRAFDKLPKSVRQALAEASRSYAPQPLLTAFRRGTPAEKIVAWIKGWDTPEALAPRALVSWGPDYVSGVLRVTPKLTAGQKAAITRKRNAIQRKFKRAA